MNTNDKPKRESELDHRISIMTSPSLDKHKEVIEAKIKKEMESWD